MINYFLFAFGLFSLWWYFFVCSLFPVLNGLVEDITSGFNDIWVIHISRYGSLIWRDWICCCQQTYLWGIHSGLVAWIYFRNRDLDAQVLVNIGSRLIKAAYTWEWVISVSGSHLSQKVINWECSYITWRAQGIRGGRKFISQIRDGQLKNRRNSKSSIWFKKILKDVAVFNLKFNFHFFRHSVRLIPTVSQYKNHIYKIAIYHRLNTNQICIIRSVKYISIMYFWFITLFFVRFFFSFFCSNTFSLLFVIACSC